MVQSLRRVRLDALREPNTKHNVALLLGIPWKITTSKFKVVEHGEFTFVFVMQAGVKSSTPLLRWQGK